MGWLSRLFCGPQKLGRTRRPSFKRQYGFDTQQPINRFERKLGRAMLREEREIFVTAFCNETEVLDVTASRGSKTTCRPTDDVFRWPERCRMLGATHVRQYHNHPPGPYSNTFSYQDLQSHQVFKEIVESEDFKFESYLIYPGPLWGFRIKRFNWWESLVTRLQSNIFVGTNV